MSESKKRLGRGLNSLLSSTRLQELQSAPPKIIEPEPVDTKKVAVTTKEQTIQEIPVNSIHKNPHQPRLLWDESKLQELADSIHANGLVQPIVVRAMGDGYQLIAGERRLRAMELAGKETITAIIKDASEEQMLEWALIENIHRADLSPLERAQAYQNYITNFSLSQSEAAKRLGEDRSNIANYMRLLELPNEIKKMVSEGELSMGHARALLSVANEAQRIELARKVIERQWSVRTLENIIKKQLAGDDEIGTPINEKSPHVQELEQEMTRSLGTKVSIKPIGKSKKRGRIIIEYYNLDDFDRIKDKLS